MDYGKINPELREYIETLSAEEKVMFKDIIEETVRRDIEMAENFEAARINAEKLSAGMQKIVEEAANIHAVVDKINSKLESVRDDAVFAARTMNYSPCWN